MSEDYNNSLYESRARRHTESSDSPANHESAARANEQGERHLLHAQLANGTLNERGNSSRRAAALQSAQGTFGNRAVQRRLASQEPQNPPESRQPVYIQRFLDGLMDMLPKDHGIGRPLMLPGMGGGGGFPSFGELPDFKGMGIGQPFMPGGGELPSFGMPDLGQFGIGNPFEMDPQYMMD